MANLEPRLAIATPPAERAAIARESYQHFARTMLDLFWSPRLRADNYLEFIEFDEKASNGRAERRRRRGTPAWSVPSTTATSSG
jgi:lauroyl/myristoyl acyltransferase